MEGSFNGKIEILQLIEGAKKAEGITVIIDVFRCFTFEAFALNANISHLYPVGEIDKCLNLKKAHPDYIIAGERDGITLPGFDTGNSPAKLMMNYDLNGKTIVHSTSSGVQGIINAKNATEIIGGSFSTAKSIAQYIKYKKPDKVSLVCMGWNCQRPTDEDTLCAKYIRSLILDEENNIYDELCSFKDGCGKHFFDNKDKDSFPMPDFFMCLMPNIFNFILKINYNDELKLYETKKVELDVDANT